MSDIGTLVSLLLQDELDEAASMWDNHRIRPSRNPRVPSGRPSIMFNFPFLWGKTDKICPVDDDKMSICKEEATFRSSEPCDPDVYKVCVDYMRASQLTPASDVQQGVTLYLRLREYLRGLVA